MAGPLLHAGTVGTAAPARRSREDRLPHVRRADGSQTDEHGLHPEREGDVGDVLEDDPPGNPSLQKSTGRRRRIGFPSPGSPAAPSVIPLAGGAAVDPLLLSLLAGLATPLGGVASPAFTRLGRSGLGAALGFAGAVMVALTAFDLVPEALARGAEIGELAALATSLLGVGTCDRLLQRQLVGAARRRVSASVRSTKGVYGPLAAVVLLGTALHDLPEGMAMAAAHAVRPVLGLHVAVALALHNIPEGVAAGSLLAAAGRRWPAVTAWTAAVGLVTPLGTLLAQTALAVNPRWQGLFLYVAAGAMLYLGGLRLLPQAWREHPRSALLGAALGWVAVALTHVV